jgi:hypothetical protein
MVPMFTCGLLRSKRCFAINNPPIPAYFCY